MSHQNNDERTDAEIMGAYAYPRKAGTQTNCVYCNSWYYVSMGHECSARDNYVNWQRQEYARKQAERRKFAESITPIVRKNTHIGYSEVAQWKEVNQDLSDRIAREIEQGESNQ